MAVSSPERVVLRSVLADATAAGICIGTFSLGGGSLVLYQSSGLVLATAGLIASLTLATLVGLWASAPMAAADDPPVRERWLVASLAVGIAGVYASFLQMNDTLAAGVAGRVGALLLLVALPAYCMGLALPVLLAWGERSQEAATGELPDAAVLGRLMGGLLLGVAVGAVATGYLLMRGVGPGPTLLGSSVLLLAPMLLHRAEEPEAQEEVIFEADTPYHALRVTEVLYPGDRQPERRLYLNGEEESGELVRSGAPTLAYIAAAEAWLSEGAPRGASYLFLGGGAYTLPRRIAERDSRARITVVELDPEVTRAAYRYFGVRREHNIRSLHGDARAFLMAEAGERYHRVYVDVYGGQESLPPALVTVEALEALRRTLQPDGVAAMNVIGTTHGPESTRFWSVVHTFASVFPEVVLYTHLGRDFPERQNFLLAGATTPGHPFPDRAGLFEPWPREEWPAPAGVLVYHDLEPDGGRDTDRPSPFALAKGEE